ncbi:hypothetical protein [Pseudomonas sp. NUPR-001]|uniref:hypothetical protein n=1 Tax=Pseudomonas sp. NUPR-001 TaxID=3416058 RepID=UPI003F98586D
MSTSSDVVSGVVNSEAYQNIVSQLKKDVGITICEELSELFCDFDAAAFDRSGLSIEELKAVFEAGSDEIRDYSIRKYKALDGASEEQEYPVGEEPDEEDDEFESENLGYAPGFLLANAIEFLLAKKGGRYLEKYLKESRVPKAGEYAKQVLSFIG